MTAVYFVVKFAAYAGWCYVGLGLFSPGLDRRARRAWIYGAVRLGMGGFFGIAIFLISNFAALAVRSQPLLYLAVYVPVRWVEWALIELLMRPGPWSPGGAVFGRDAPSRGWRARGILLSCIADIPVILSIGGLPLGRFMC